MYILRKMDGCGARQPMVRQNKFLVLAHPYEQPH